MVYLLTLPVITWYIFIFTCYHMVHFYLYLLSHSIFFNFTCKCYDIVYLSTLPVTTENNFIFTCYDIVYSFLYLLSHRIIFNFTCYHIVYFSTLTVTFNFTCKCYDVVYLSTLPVTTENNFYLYLLSHSIYSFLYLLSHSLSSKVSQHHTMGYSS